MKSVLLSKSATAQPLGAALLGIVLALGIGCGKQAAPGAAARTDQQITSDVQAKIAGESALNGQSIDVAVASGIVTLSGTASDNASRALAGNDAGTVSGVKTVVNNLSVAPQQAAAPPPPPPSVAPKPPAPVKAPVKETPKETKRERREREREQQRELAQQSAPPPPAIPAAVPEPAPQPAPPPPPPPPPPQPVAKTVTLPAGTVIPVRVTDSLSSQNAQPNQVFHATLAGDLIADGMVAVPRGANILGRVVDAKDAAHFSGSALLSLELTQINTPTRQIPVVTNPYSQEGKGRGKNTAVKTGGGAALGAIIGALAGGGKGAAIGAAAGGGLGAGTNAVTRGQQVQIAPETLVNFQLQSPITVTTTRAVGAGRSYGDNAAPNPQLDQRSPQ